MPVKLPINYEEIKAAYCKGLSIAELARQYGLKEGTLRARVMRNGWKVDATKAAQAVQRSVRDAVGEKAKIHVETVLDVLDRHIQALRKKDPENLDLESFDLATRILDRLDTIGRRSHGLDSAEHSAKHSTLVQVVVNHPGAQLPVQYEESGAGQAGQATIDVDAVSSAERKEG